MKRLLLISPLCWLLLSILGTAASGQEATYPPNAKLEQIRQLVDAASKEHPRLFATSDDFQRIRDNLDQDPLREQLAAAIIRQADQLLEVPPIERRLQGRRLLGQSRRAVKRTSTLAMAFHLTNDGKYAQRCEAEMLAAARFKDWNPSHFLDVAEMTFALAVGYDWLFHELDDSSRAEIRQAIVDQGVALPFRSRHNGWVRASNNWGQVCHGGLTAGALAVMEDEPTLAAQTVHNAIQNVTRSMAAYAPCGSYPEGPSYWAYGTSYNVLLIDALESCLGTDFGLSLAPGFSQTGQFLSLACGPSGQFFNYADGSSTRRPQPILFWFASRYDRPDWLLGERERVSASIRELDGRQAGSQTGRFEPFSLLWMRTLPKSLSIRMPLNWFGQGSTPITIHRSSWVDRAATYVGFKAGSPSASHGQMDIGSFVLDADGRRWALDLGAEGYHGIESRGMNLWDRSQGSDRWKIFRQSNEGHNTLVIDGSLQHARGRGDIVAFSDDPQAAFSVLDMSSVYQGQAESVRRGVRLLPTGEVLIRDELSGLKPNSRVRWGMITRGKTGSPQGAKLALHQDETTLSLSILEPSSMNWKIVDTANPRHEWDSPNRGTRMVAFEAVAPESGSLTLVVKATPGSCTTTGVKPDHLSTLEQWSDSKE
jgi:hypothetical protein